MIGSLISHYKIIQKLGAGGMGEVYKAEDTRLERLVAIKILPELYNSNEEFKERFIREARAASALDHPNICNIHEIDETETGQLFIVMNYYEGDTLEKIISSGIPKISESIRIVKQIATGLSAAHKSQLIHRDIKPSNIIITKEGIVKILDFGLAKVANRSQLTRFETCTGTIAYMSPEQSKGYYVDHHTDIWALGVIIYEMLTGKLPFPGEYDQAIIYSILNEFPDSIQVSDSSIEKQINSIVNKCLAKSPIERFKDLSELITELNKIKIEVDNDIQIKAIKQSEMSNSSNLRSTLVILIIILLSALVIYLLQRQFFSHSKLTINLSRQLTFESGLEIDPVISPDGKTIAYVAGDLKNTNVFIKQLSGGRAINLTQNFNGNHRWPRWSPDGNKITFQAEGNIYIIPSLGGNPKPLVKSDSNEIYHSLTWSPDGEKIAFVAGEKVYFASIEGSDKTFEFETDDPHSLVWSPDGKFIAFVSGNKEYLFGLEGEGNMIGNIAPSSIWIYSIDKKEKIKITDNINLNMSPVWSKGGEKLFYVSSQGGGRDIYSIDVSTTGEISADPQRLTSGLSIHSIHLSPDDNKLLYSDYDYISNIWAIKIPEKGTVSLEDAKPITTGKQTIEGVSVSNDGKWLAFDSNKNGNMDIFIMPISGGEAVQLTTGLSDDCYPSWSPDDKELCFYSFRNSFRNIFTISLADYKISRITNSSSQDRLPLWPEKNKIFFISDRSGDNCIYSIERNDKKSTWKKPKAIQPIDEYNYDINNDGIISYSFEKTIWMKKPNSNNPKYIYSHLKSDTQSVSSGHTWLKDNKSIIIRCTNGKGNDGFWRVFINGGNPVQLVKFDTPVVCYEAFDTNGDQIFFTIGKHESDIYLLELSSD